MENTLRIVAELAFSNFHQQVLGQGTAEAKKDTFLLQLIFKVI